VLRQVVRRSAAPVRRVAIALPGGLVIEKLVSMPAGCAEEAIAERLSSDIAQLVPFALEDAAVDFQAIAPDPDDPQCQRIVIAACHLALLDVLHASLEFAGMRACVVEPDRHALHRAVQAEDTQESVLLHVEADALVFHEWGVEPLPLRREVPGYVQGDYVQWLATAVDNYLLSSPGRALPGQLLLSGAGVAQPHVAGQLQQRLGLQVRLADPFKQLALAPGLEPRTLRAQAPCLVVACGLAMREDERCLR
jgi:type IV pilus assembly protein PilM